MEFGKEAEQGVGRDSSSVDSDKLAAKRTDYYRKWDKFADETNKQLTEEEKREKDAANEKLGIKEDAPRSEHEKKDMEKRAALREAKKLWENKKLAEETQKFSVGKEHHGQELIIDDQVLQGKRVVHIFGGRKSKFVVPESSDKANRLVKLFIEDCEDCTIVVASETISQHCEVSHCKNTEIDFRSPSAVVQLDVCSNCSINFGPKAFTRGLHKIFHAGVSNSSVRVHEENEEDIHHHEVNYLVQGAEAIKERTAEEFQFVTHWVDGKLVTEPVYRSKGNMPLTQAEINEVTAKGAGDGLQNEERMAELKKVGGNEAFAEGNYAQAAVYYTEAMDFCDAGSKLLPVLYANRSQANLKLGRLTEALEDADKTIELDPAYCKGHFRRGLALHSLKRYRDAGMALTKALDIEPKNQQIKQALGFADLRLRQQLSGAQSA